MNIGIIGAGSWGTAISKILLNNGHTVRIWTRDTNVYESLTNGENPYYLPGISIPKTIIPSIDLKDVVVNSKLIVLAIPTQAVREVAKQIKSYYQNQIIVNLAKGLEINSQKRISEILSEVLGNVKYVILSGPSHAEEVARDIPTSVVAASENKNLAKITQETFSNVSFRVYTNDDVIGVELGGSIKNVIAISAGIIDGIGGWDNSKAALITRGLAEIIRYGKKKGAKKETFMGLAGLGDLIVTCNSLHSRNRYVGEMIGRGKKLNEIIENMNMVAEGIYTVKALYDEIKALKVEMPIIEKTYEVLYLNKDPRKAIHELMMRELKDEN
ncbi:glycerol 3-phosphate dehydrogenase (NAD(P)+) [Marinitoga hydrogenitolerans DSM 16785]|uniref:Glycerol-3-phosphate dehydrogenase [NAD(P)+] n=1 Tax=Marinitoga hydrogenitolerans (strain DSM 16785 / JCM 12826 / AT1271) TaxID=1122195 RepID=A0A1M4V993_MARH1|nr:NAD(P)H-dependent glycerol-3-phosphate dehydrogenase [Marinitoga hydrogenitolerans]SHE65457.1 glycerol 3-phosphate dehydrogenase (NAD(P)+) [Marinitoga hydrogenitolerans DSM 16785]